MLDIGGLVCRARLVIVLGAELLGLDSASENVPLEEKRNLPQSVAGVFPGRDIEDSVELFEGEPFGFGYKQ